MSRMLRRLQQHSITPGSFFAEYSSSLQALAEAQEALLPATLKSTSTTVDDSMEASLTRATKALEWQQAQLQILQRLPGDARNVTSWPLSAVSSALHRYKIVHSKRELARIPEEEQLEILADYMDLLRVFQFTYESMPDVRSPTRPAMVLPRRSPSTIYMYSSVPRVACWMRVGCVLDDDCSSTG